MRKIEIFDTTLRDGEQSAGVNLHTHEKLEIAYQLARYGVTVMEAGYPASSPGDFDAVSQIARAVRGCTIAGLARHVQGDIDAVWGALQHAEAPRLHLFIATSPIHMRDKLRMTPDQVFETAVAMVKYGARKFPDIEWSAEDATRSDWDFLAKIVTAVIDAGATVINLPDTVGYTTPHEYGSLFRYMLDHVPNIHKAKLSAHCHDDLGMAVANSIAAIEAGVHQVEGTINGIGERAGNASIEEIAVALAIRRDFYQAETGLDLTQTVRTSRLVSKLTGMVVPPNKAVVGANAFAHESGIHQDGVLKNVLTYEIIRPEMVGLSSNALVLGKHSGRHAFRGKCEELGLHLTDDEFNQLFQNFKLLTEKKKEVTDDDILALALEASANSGRPHYELASMHVSYGTHAITTTTLAIQAADGTVLQEAATGNGSVEAIYRTIERLLNHPVDLQDYRIQSTTSGKDSLAEVYVKVGYQGMVGSGRGVDNDVLAASAKAFLDAINRIALKQEFKEVGVS
ncbi:2-isopropylmalate synthase [Alicyclobacillus cycloheptanicus]|uniref:2-isopropylmalate synthase n=1 Tax=Alicyclobacillus cycloheptanicus TaxID=1457 RepID=A0ABT9XGT4_9BACL|nr:2-isopropylmalate synthase [Alicyclobacillus cycloheptanicus]MDQ0188956.1 2-isopropylmalate synthase [Alicyclobacillus cycloheptanicus]WDM01695.1 2-isopropylmalate synthase [Alicyclobacillus cycloheptanicus]